MPAQRLAEDKASKACRHCRLHKRGCDKRLPRCSRCAEKMIKCDYDEDTPLELEPPTKLKWREPLAIRRGPCGLELTSAGEKQLLWTACGGQEKFPDADSKVLMGLVKDVLAYGGTSVQEVSNKYFATCHAWLPILDSGSTKFNVRIMLKNSEMLDDFLGLLLLCMHLVNQKACHHPNHTSNNLLYRTTRRLFHLLEDPDHVSSHNKLQAGLLLTAYECGHGMTKEASATLGTCFGLIRQLDISARQHTNNILYSDDNLAPIRRLCWACIVFLDRSIVLSCADSSAALLLPTREILPPDMVPYMSLGNYNRYMSEERKFRTRAYSALSIGEAIKAVHGDPTSSDCIEAERLLHNLVRQHAATSQGEEYPVCEGVTMALSAVISAYKKRAKHLGSAADAKLNLDIKFAYNITFEMCRVEGSLMRKRDKSRDRMCFSGLGCLYRAAVDLDEIYPRGASAEDIKQLRENLVWFSGHWGSAGILLKRLDQNAEMRSKQGFSGVVDMVTIS